MAAAPEIDRHVEVPPGGVFSAVYRAVVSSRASLVSAVALIVMVLACTCSLPFTMGRGGDGALRFDSQSSTEPLRPPWWAEGRSKGGMSNAENWHHLGTDLLGRDLLVRVLAGGAISLLIGLVAAGISVVIGTLYGAISGWCGGRVDAVLMRVVDVLYGLPYVLLVVLLAVAGSAVLDEFVSRSRARTSWMVDQVRAAEPSLSATAAVELIEKSPALREDLMARAATVADLQPRRLSVEARAAYDITTLFVAIGGVSWLTLARVVRGQVLSLKARPFIEAARALGTPAPRVFLRHVLPNLAGVIVVYATLTVPQAILQESFLSFLGIGVKPPLPSWGNLAADGIEQINPIKSNWWLLVVPCVLLGGTLLALNFVGEALRRALDPKRV